MIEQGFVEYVQNGLAALSPPVTVPGGFDTELPKDEITISAAIPQAWSYRSIVAIPDYNLAQQTGWVEWHVQVDCHGNTSAAKIALTRAIQEVLRGGFTGAFPDGTFVFQLVQLPTQVDGFSGINRSYVRSLEYAISYQQV